MEYLKKCILCDSPDYIFRFSKKGRNGETFQLCRCSKCGLEFINPRPDENEIGKYYTNNYFMQRDQRGYDNYYSDKVKKEIERVYLLNLKDLGFFDYEAKLSETKKSLDIGCAAGYFVELLKKRGWQSSGIDIASDCIKYGQESLGLDLIDGSYLKYNPAKKYDLITLWATIEHLHNPSEFLKKINSDLADDGILYLTTCRIDGPNFKNFFASRWRFYNFPEHLVFFSKKNIKKILKEEGFKVNKIITYGSGFGKGVSLIRKIADFKARHFGMGDMMLVSASKIKQANK